MRGRTIAAFRKKDRLSQAELAEKATECLRTTTGDATRSISESLIALIETGRRQPSRENAEAIAAALGLTEFAAIGDITVFADEEVA